MAHEQLLFARSSPSLLVGQGLVARGTLGQQVGVVVPASCTVPTALPRLKMMYLQTGPCFASCALMLVPFQRSLARKAPVVLQAEGVTACLGTPSAAFRNRPIFVSRKLFSAPCAVPSHLGPLRREAARLETLLPRGVLRLASLQSSHALQAFQRGLGVRLGFVSQLF